MLVLLLLLISRLINRLGLRMSHSKVFSSGEKADCRRSYLWGPLGQVRQHEVSEKKS